MPLPLSNSFETGLADETTITDVNSDDGSAGNAFDFVTIGGAGTFVFDNARSAHGTLSGRATQDAANGIYCEWQTSMGVQTEIYGRVYIYRTAHPTPTAQWLILPDNGGAASAALVRWHTTGKLDIFDSTLSASTATTNDVPLNAWVRIEWRLLCNTSNGIIEAKMFNADDSSPIETITRTSQNTLTQIDRIYLGQGAANASGSSFWLDDLAVNATGYPGPASSGAAPTLRTASSGLRW